MSAPSGGSARIMAELCTAELAVGALVKLKADR